MAGYETGCLAWSLAGHDKEGIFIIIKEDAEYVYLADGRLRTVGNRNARRRNTFRHPASAMKSFAISL